MASVQSILPPLTVGGLFGSALTLAGVASPAVIINQLRLTDFHMLLAFMSASACSAVIVVASNASGYAKLEHRKDSSYGWFRYDGNVVGGALQGMGMALTGACPGTVFVQAAAGVQRAWWVMAGGAIGGVMFVRWNQRVKARGTIPGDEHTIMQKTGMSTSATVLTYELLLLATITAANTLAPIGKYFLNPVMGGLLIGAAQAASVVLSKKTVGVSSAFEDAGKSFWATVRGTARPDLGNVMFAFGVGIGAALTMRYVPATKEAVVTPLVASPLLAVAGGAAASFGARLAGGCTSGHGISGMATMAVSSFITVAMMFGAGIAVAGLR